MKTGYGDHFKKMKVQKGLEAGDSIQTSSVANLRNRLQERQVRLKKLKSRKKFPVRSLVFSVVGAGLTLFAMLNHGELDHLLQKIEVSFMGQAQAQTGAKSETAGKDKANSEKGSETTGEKSTEKADKNAAGENKDGIDHFLKLSDRKKALDLREEELNRLEAELQKQREEIETKIKTLENTRAGISTVLEERAVKDSEKVDTLVQMYSNMKPSQAAKVLESMDEDLAVEIVGRMKKKNAAEVMNLMKSEKAQVFSEKYAGYRKR